MTEITTIDAFVVGAGMGGIYSTYRLSRMGLTVQCVDIASDVGGTWYWNRYPGAMSDTESYLYRYSWDKEDLQTYPWTHHYVYQPEILEYLRHIVSKHDLRKYMQFNTEMTAATWDDSISRWMISCSGGVRFHARYLINALGIISKIHHPDIEGISSFAGDLVHTAKWPENLNLEGKRVGIIGNGSTGIQVMTAIAPTVGALKLFQRHAQYSVPSGQAPVTSDYRESINAKYDEIWKSLWSSTVAFGVPESQRKAMEVDGEERRKAFQEVWDQGNGFRFMFSAFGDVATDRAANEEACKFIHSKIDEIVKDPRKADILKPSELYARRPLCDSGYYQIFNQDNVDIIDLQSTPIRRIVSQGIETADGKIHELDVLITATGFDVIEGNYMRIKITGRDGKSMQDHWKEGIRAFGSIACAKFPNMFIVGGPQGPFANFPPVLEAEVNLIMNCIEYAEGREISPSDYFVIKDSDIIKRTRASFGKDPVILEVSEKAENEWIDLCNRLTEGSLFKTTTSWLFGKNIPGRRPATKFYFGGLKNYLEWAQKEIASGLPSFEKL